jgi:outer membrane protein TolC
MNRGRSFVHRRTPQLIVLILSMTVLPALVGASETSIEVPTLPEQMPSPPKARDGALSLDLQEAYRLALTRNLNLQVRRFDVASSQASILESVGIFDPSFQLSVSGDDSETPTATTLEGAEVQTQRNTSFNLSLGQTLPTGTTWSTSGTMSRRETNSEFFFLNPSWNGTLRASITQPLLRGFGTVVNRANLEVAKSSRQQTLHGFESDVVGTLQQVENAYWDLIAAREQITVTQQSMELAQRLLDETRERVRVGTSAPIDTVQSEATVAQRRQDLIISRNRAAEAADALKQVLGFDRPEEWRMEIETTEDVEAEAIEPDLAESITTALANRPEIQQQKALMATLEINEKVARNNLLPQLDLQASYRYAGTGGTLTAEDPVTGEVFEEKGGAGDAWQQIIDRQFPGWSMQLNLSMPLGNNQAKGRLAQRTYALEQAEVQLKALEQQIIQEVRQAVRGLRDSAATIEAAQATRRLQERNLEAEQTKFANGLSTNYQVLEIQEDLANAQLSEINALIAYRKALVAYKAATGQLLDSEGIAVIDPEAPEVPHDILGDVEWLQFVDLESAASKVTRPAEPVERAGSE